ncbi:MAG TPA: hypothetical protein VIO61_08060 [Anaerolineaceae bacterium]
MTTIQKIFYFFVLPCLGPLMFPPSTFTSQSGLILMAIVLVFLLGLGMLQLQGRSNALTFAIFLQGLNVIVRLMMVFPGAVSKDFKTDPIFILTMVAGIAISTFLLLRLDKNDIRRTMRT